MPTRSSWSRSPPRTPGTSSLERRRWSAAGRPPCPFCLQPMDPAGHICPRANGYRRPLIVSTVRSAAATHASRTLHRWLGGDLEITGRLVQASNATFLAELDCGEGTISCVYKPAQGERPLWDFPHGTLGMREVAAYEVSRIGGFDLSR